MKQTALAAIALLFACVCAVLRGGVSPSTQALPPSPGGVVLLAVEGLPVFGQTREYDDYTTLPLPHIKRLADRGLVGLVTTRGEAAQDDSDAGLHTLLAGSRSPEPDAVTLVEAAKSASTPFALHTFTGQYALRDADAFAGSLGNAAVVVAGITPPADALHRRERVAPLIIWTPETDALLPRLLTSPSTRNRVGLCAATDVAATVAQLLGVRTRIGDGRAARIVATAQSPAALWTRLRGNAAAWGQQAREQKLLPGLPWMLAGLATIALFAQNSVTGRAARVAALAAPVSLIAVAPLVPSPSPAWVVYVLATLVAATLAGCAARSESWGRRLPRYLAVATAAIIAVDSCTGGFLLARTPLSYSVLEAARFYGIGNEVSGLFLGAALLAVGRHVAATLLWGGAVAVVFGAPTLGADAGGFVAALLAFATLALVNTGTAGWGKRGVLIAAGAIVCAVLAFAAWDGSRPLASRTHIGVAFARARQHGARSLLPMVRRKASMNARLLTSSPWAVLLLAQLTTVLLRRHQATREQVMPPVPVKRADRAALLIATLSLFVLNDSGVVAGATCALWHNAEP